MSKLSFRARALDASKPLPVFRCEDLPDLHEYASINRAVPQMPTGMEKEEESVRVNSPVRPTTRPRSLCCLRRRRRSSIPTQNGRHLLFAADSVAGRALTPPSPASTPGRRGPAGPLLKPPADPGRLYQGPAEFRGPKGTKGSRDGAAGSHFVVLVFGLGLVHPERGAGWVAVGLRRAGLRGGRACRPLRGPLGGAPGPPRPPRAAGSGSADLVLSGGIALPGGRAAMGLGGLGTWIAGLRAFGSLSLPRPGGGTACLPGRLKLSQDKTYFSASSFWDFCIHPFPILVSQRTVKSP